VNVIEVDTGRRSDVRKFLQFPFDLYRDCAEWTPPVMPSARLALNRKRHPFYNHSEATFFLAEEDGEVLGRIAVLNNRRYNAHTGGKVAFFYYFDTVDDVRVVRGLFDAARGWARDRNLEVIKGPKGMLRADAYGVLIKGHEQPASMGIPYNYPYYATLLEEVGAEKEVDYYTGYMTAADELPDRLFRLAERIKERRGFWVKSFTSKRELREWVPRIQKVNNEAFVDVWVYYPIDRAEVEMIGDQLLLVSDPRLLKVVMKGDEIAGFAFVFPDLAETLRATKGRLWPFGWIRFLIALKTTNQLLGNGVGLLPQHQGMGASALLYVALHDTLRSRGVNYIELVQAMETNLKSLGDMNMLGVHWHKIHRVYRLPV
jgi:GNAT superfamily N-acetyltransferase